MSISKPTVEHIAGLAKLSFDETELARLGEELGKILAYVEKLRELNVEGIRPTLHGSGASTPMREDVACENSLSRDEVLEAAPESEKGHFKVPRVI